MNVTAANINSGIPIWIKVAGIGTLIFGIAAGSQLITNAMVYAGITFIGFFVTWHKAGPRFKLFTINHPIIADFLLTGLSYVFMGTGVTAMFGAGIVGFGFNLFFEYAEKYNKASLEKMVADLDAAKKNKRSRAVVVSTRVNKPVKVIRKQVVIRSAA